MKLPRDEAPGVKAQVTISFRDKTKRPIDLDFFRTIENWQDTIESWTLLGVNGREREERKKERRREEETGSRIIIWRNIKRSQFLTRAFKSVVLQPNTIRQKLEFTWRECRNISPPSSVISKLLNYFYINYIVTSLHHCAVLFPSSSSSFFFIFFFKLIK